MENKNPDSSTHTGYIRDNIIPKKYYWQVIQYFVVIDTLETLDFISYDSRIKLDSLKMLIVPTNRKELEEHINLATEELIKFNKEVEDEINKLTF